MFKNICLFIYFLGCAGSLLLRGLFSSCRERGLRSSCNALASRVVASPVAESGF